jgi:hypothetical protein
MSRIHLHAVLPNARDVLALEPEELAGYMLEWFNSVPDIQLNRYSISLEHIVEDYPEAYRHQLQMALMEAWVWLEGHSFIAPVPGTYNHDGQWFFVTRRGKKIKRAAELKAYRESKKLC